jgi:hypothetical protein
MSTAESTIYGLMVTFNNNVQTLLNLCNANIKNILLSKLTIINKNKNIKQIQNYFNLNYNKLKNKLNVDKINAQAQSQSQSQSQVLTVNKSALLIGCNYIGTPYELSGCINDIVNLQDKIKTQYGFTNILIMTDATSKKPTKANILDEITVLLNNSKSGDILFIGFSGHGTKTADTNGDETDSFDEMFVPLDFQCISDDEMKLCINKHLKKDVTVFALFDCCHSGTILDLRYQYLDSENYENSTENLKETETVGNIIMLSGCMDNQISADAYIYSKYQGAMTWSFLDTVNKKPNLTWKELITGMRSTLLKSDFQQMPQLSSGRKLDLTAQICLL